MMARLRGCNIRGQRPRLQAGLFALAAMVLLSGCELRQAMYDQPKLLPLQESDFFADGMASRHPVEHTIARGYLQDDPHLYDGMVDGAMAETFPFEITMEVMNRGQERYNIFCATCHDRSGYGNGIIVQRGFKRPTAFHEQRLVESPVGYFYQVVKNGFGVMNGYADQIPVSDRWAIVAYVRALQYSQTATLEDVPDDVLAELMGAEETL
jgi:cytochrome c553